MTLVPVCGARLIAAGDAKFWYNSQVLLGLLVSAHAHIVCIPHEIESFDSPANKEHLAPFAGADRLSVVTLVEHASQRVREALGRWTEEDPMWSGVRVDDFTPVSTFIAIHDAIADSPDIRLAAVFATSKDSSSGSVIRRYIGQDVTVGSSLSRDFRGTARRDPR
jgi:hypothetical protein